MFQSISDHVIFPRELFHLKINYRDIHMPIFENGPFEKHHHMVQNSLCWIANCKLGRAKQSDLNHLSF